MSGKDEKRVLAFDFGASSGRAMLGSYGQNGIELREVHRFSNDPVYVNGTLYWDVLRLVHEIKQGILKAKEIGFDSIGIDTWGVDFGLLDEEGNLIENPVHYRDRRTEGMLENVLNEVSREELYEITGNQFMEINTLFQLRSLVLRRPELIERAETMLMMPDLLNYILTGVMATEYSIASTSQMLDAREKKWAYSLLDKLSIPHRLLTEIIPTGTKIGNLTSKICEELQVESVPVIAVAGHDTQCAMAAVPSELEDFIFLSCGTWSLLGTELAAPIMNEKTVRYDITNEGGYGGKTSFLKNIIGLWLIQESRRQWKREGMDYGFGELEELAEAETPFHCFIDPDAPEFVAPGDVPERICAYCRRTGQPVPETIGQIVRCIDESLAMKYRIVLSEIQDCTGKEYQTIHIVGGGAQSRLLCQMTANACGMRVIAGPIEATVLGNIAIQLVACGAVSGISEVRSVLKNNGDIVTYEPEKGQEWQQAFNRYQKIIM